MSRPANPYDDLEHLRTNIEEFIEQYYNRQRLHSDLARISHQSRDKERVAGFGGERGRWIESWGALARVL